jgi:hypothetical protein
MKIHPNTPPRLAKKYKELKSFHAVAEDRRVNVSYIHALIAEGKEPNDTTPKLREVRRRLFLSTRKKRRQADPASPKPPMPVHRQWWMSLDKSQRENIIRQTYELNK